MSRREDAQRVWDWLPARARRSRVTIPSVIAANLDMPLADLMTILARMESDGHVVRDTVGGSGYHRGRPLTRPIAPLPGLF